MMDFAQAWDSLTTGDYVSVSDGMIEPSQRGGTRWWGWRSHNFIGQFQGRRDGTARKLLFLLPRYAHADVTLEICSSQTHTFQLSTAESFASVENGL